jgi:hypothetical protein
MSFYGAGSAEDAALSALKGTGLRGWCVYASDRSRVLLSGPAGIVSPVRLKRLRSNWVRLGGQEIEHRGPGAQRITLLYEQSEDWERAWEAYFSASGIAGNNN